MVLGFLADLESKQAKTVLKTFVALYFKLVAHIINTVIKLKESVKTTNNFDLEKLFLLELVLI